MQSLHDGREISLSGVKRVQLSIAYKGRNSFEVVLPQLRGQNEMGLCIQPEDCVLSLGFQLTWVLYIDDSVARPVFLLSLQHRLTYRAGVGKKDIFQRLDFLFIDKSDLCRLDNMIHGNDLEYMLPVVERGMILRPVFVSQDLKFPL